jgi:hypothetical protein
MFTEMLTAYLLSLTCPDMPCMLPRGYQIPSVQKRHNSSTKISRYCAHLNQRGSTGLHLQSDNSMIQRLSKIALILKNRGEG